MIFLSAPAATCDVSFRFRRAPTNSAHHNYTSAHTALRFIPHFLNYRCCTHDSLIRYASSGGWSARQPRWRCTESLGCCAPCSCAHEGCSDSRLDRHLSAGDRRWTRHHPSRASTLQSRAGCSGSAGAGRESPRCAGGRMWTARSAARRSAPRST